MYSFMQSFIHSFRPSLIRSFIYSFLTALEQTTGLAKLYGGLANARIVFRMQGTLEAIWEMRRMSGADDWQDPRIRPLAWWVSSYDKGHPVFCHKVPCLGRCKRLFMETRGRLHVRTNWEQETKTQQSPLTRSRCVRMVKYTFMGRKSGRFSVVRRCFSTGDRVIRPRFHEESFSACLEEPRTVPIIWTCTLELPHPALNTSERWRLHPNRKSGGPVMRAKVNRISLSRIWVRVGYIKYVKINRDLDMCVPSKPAWVHEYLLKIIFSCLGRTNEERRSNQVHQEKTHKINVAESSSDSAPVRGPKKQLIRIWAPNFCKFLNFSLEETVLS